MSSRSAESTQEVTKQLIAAAEALGPLIAAHQDALSRGPDLPPEIAQALEEAGLTRLWLPRSLGGAELPPVDYFRVIEAIAKHDGAVGWCASIASTGCRAAGLIPQSAAAGLLADGGFVSGSLNPSGTAVRENNGWRVTGRWSWGSFIAYSKATLAVCMEQDNGAADAPPRSGPTLRAVLLPTREVNIVRNWDGGGLRSSGSHDFTIDNVFVEETRTFSLTDFVAQPHQPGALYALPFITMFALGIGAVSLGIARGSIDALIDLAQHKIPTVTRIPLREQPGVQAAVAEAETSLRAARGFLFESVQTLWERQVAGQPDDIAQRAQVRMAACNVAQAAKKIADQMFSAAGGSAVHARSPFGTQLRDAQAVAQHLAFSPRTMETAGRVLLGMDAGTSRF